MMVGGYMWGYLADQRGRCRVLVVSLSVNGVFGALASVAPSFWFFLLLRFISGIGSAQDLHHCLSFICCSDHHTMRSLML